MEMRDSERQQNKRAYFSILNVPTKHFLLSFQSRKWEKQLQQVFDETDPETLAKAAQSELEKYYASLPSTGSETGSRACSRN